MGVVCGILDLRADSPSSPVKSELNTNKMAGETAVETPQDNTKVEETIKTDKEVIAEEEAAQANEEKKDEEKKPAEEAMKAKEPKAKKPVSHVADFEEDMVYLFQFTRSPQIPSISPFCLKLESWLKLHGIKYQNVDHKCKFRSKKGLLPFIELNGEEIADSNMIIETLSKKFENFGKKDLLTLSEMLGEKEFFFGDEPAMLVMVDKEFSCPLRDYLEADCKNLVGLVNRMKDRCWADHWDNATGEEMDLNPHIPKPEPPAPEPEKKEEEKEKAEEKKEEKEKVNMLTKLSNAFSKLKPQPSAAASPAPEAKAEETPSDKPEAEAEEKKEEEKKEEEKKEEKEEENKEKESESEEKK